MHFHHSVADLQRRVLRIIAEGLGAHETFFDEMLTDGATLTRAIHYPAMEQAPGEQHVGPANTPTSTSSRRCPAPRRPVYSSRPPTASGPTSPRRRALRSSTPV